MGSAPKIPPPQNYEFKIPPMPTFEFPAIEFPSYPDPEDIERKKKKARDEELASILGRKERGREGTMKTGPLGIEDEKAPVQRPGLLAQYR